MGATDDFSKAFTIEFTSEAAWNDEIKSSDQGEHHGSPVGLKASKGPSKDAEGQS
jgi:hypothetical protein